MFVDEVSITVKAGRGGDGVCSFRREKFVPRGGPDGGDGGDGGDVVFGASQRLTTLLDLRYQKHYEAEDGKAGGGSNCTGRRGEDPSWCCCRSGPSIYDLHTGELLADLVTDGDSVTIARGGKGGRGNSHFATSTNRVPTHFERGTAGEERVAAARTQTAGRRRPHGISQRRKIDFDRRNFRRTPEDRGLSLYHAVPNLGVVRWAEDRSFVVADIPGFIEGAHEGKGLGIQFLPAYRTHSLLLHLIDVSEWARKNPWQASRSCGRS